MLRRLDEGTDNVLGYEVEGELTEKEFETLSEGFKAAVVAHGKVRLLVLMARLPRMEPGALLEDFKLAPYANDIERYAIVSDSAVAGWAEKIGGAVIRGEVRRFEVSRQQEAWRWLRS